MGSKFLLRKFRKILTKIEQSSMEATDIAQRHNVLTELLVLDNSQSRKGNNKIHDEGHVG